VPPQSIKVLGCNALGVVVMTWGLVGTMTWAAVAALCSPSGGGGCAVRVTSDWLGANGTSPVGQTLSQMMSEFQALLPPPSSNPPSNPPSKPAA
jgi:hypothetical protein